jgi:hypothetical protein
MATSVADVGNGVCIAIIFRNVLNCTQQVHGERLLFNTRTGESKREMRGFFLQEKSKGVRPVSSRYQGAGHNRAFNGS